SKLSTLAAILNKNPKPVVEINAALPQELGRIIDRCLRKDVGKRYQHMGDIKVDLEELKEQSDSGTQVETLEIRPGRRTWFWAGAALLIVGTAFAVWLFRGVGKKRLAAPRVVPLTSYAGLGQSPSSSPDGNQVAFSWNGDKQNNFDIYLKLVG